MLTDLEIAQKAYIKKIEEISEETGIKEEELEPYGKYMGKVSLSILDRLKDKPDGKLIAITAINPTPLGEGKTVTSIGLGEGLAKLGKKVCNTLRQPSKGPMFGIKGGACGGGYSQVLPMEKINLHFTGDIYAVETAHNLLAAMADASILHGNKLNIDPQNLLIRRCMDLNDRALRNIIIGLGGIKNGIPRETGFDITPATETMAILALAENLSNLKTRLGKMVIGFTRDGNIVTARDINVSGAMAVTMKDAIKPNLVQTTENTPVLIHGGPFANVGHGNSSIIADKVALKLTDYVVTESGFGSDCGFEKLVNIKCRSGGLKISAAVIVVSLRALKMHGGAYKVSPGKKMPEDLIKEVNIPALSMGCENLKKHIEIVKKHGVPAIVAINKFPSDTEEELKIVKDKALEYGASHGVISECWEKGGEGAVELAEAVVQACNIENEFHYLYELHMPVEKKVEIIAKEIYGAKDIEFLPKAKKSLRIFKKAGYDNLPVNMAKTHLSLSHNPDWKNVPKDFILPIEDVRLSAGAGFIYTLIGNIITMPGLSSDPACVHLDIDEHGNTVGMS